MHVTATSPGRPVREGPRLTYREILVLFLPLAATSTMMSASIPIINAGLARLTEPKLNLAAFGLAFTLGIFLESPVFAIQQAVVAWYGGRGRFRHLLWFSLGVGAVVTVYEALVAFSPAAPYILQRLMGADAVLTARAVPALRVAVVFPLLIAVRSMLQAVLISRRITAPIGWGTLMRLAVLAVSVALWAPRLPLGGPAAAMICLLGAVMVEMIYVAVSILRSPEGEEHPSPALEAGRTLWGRVRFILPLMGMMALGTLTNPLINTFLTRTRDPQTALAAYAVIASLVWFLASPFLRYSSIAITLGTTDENRRLLGTFLWKTVGLLTVVLVFVHFTPTWKVFLTHAMGLSPELTAKVRGPLMILTLQPLVAALVAYNQGLLTRSDRTWVVGFGGIARVAGILAGGTVGLMLGLDGALLGGILLGLAFLSEMILLALVRRRAERTA